MSQNRINIETADLQLQLEGNDDDVVEAYEAIRSVLARHLEATIESNRGDCDDSEVPGGGQPRDDRV